MSSVPLGYDVPDFKRKIASTKQHSNMISVGGGLSGGRPMLTAAMTVANMNSSTAEVAEDTVGIETASPMSIHNVSILGRNTLGCGS